VRIGEKFGNRKVYVGVELIDRLSRQEGLEALRLLTELIDLRCYPIIKGKVITPTFLRENPGYWHELIGAINTASEESEKKAQRLKETNAEKRRNARAGIRNEKSGMSLFGGARCPGFLRPNPETDKYEFIERHKPTLERIIAEAWKIGSPLIASRLNDDKVETFDKRKRKGGNGGWWSGTVRNVLTNTALYGEWQPHEIVEIKDDEGKVIDTERRPCGDPISNYFPAIMTKDEWDSLQAVIHGNYMGGGRRGPVYANLFTGIGRCGCPTCNSGLTLDKKSPMRANLRCGKSKRRGCGNKVGFPYAVFEATMLSLVGVGMQRMIANIVAGEEPHDSDRHQLETLEISVADKESRLKDMFTRFGSSSVAAIRDGAATQIEALGIEIDADKARMAKLRNQVRLRQYDRGFAERVSEAEDRLRSSDDDTRFMARAALAQEFRGYLDHVMLMEDGRMVARIKPHNRLNAVDVIVTGTGLEAIEVRSQTDDTVLMRYEGAGLAMLDPLPGASEAA